eukprot:473173-Rhodomonas_salina.3
MGAPTCPRTHYAMSGTDTALCVPSLGDVWYSVIVLTSALTVQSGRASQEHGRLHGCDAGAKSKAFLCEIKGLSLRNPKPANPQSQHSVHQACAVFVFCCGLCHDFAIAMEADGVDVDEFSIPKCPRQQIIRLHGNRSSFHGNWSNFHGN